MTVIQKGLTQKMTCLFTPFPQARHKPVFPLHSSRKPGLFVSDSAKLRLFLQEWRVTRHPFDTRKKDQRSVLFTRHRFLGKNKQERPCSKAARCLFQENDARRTKKSAIFLVREKLHFVFSLKGSTIRASFF